VNSTEMLLRQKEEEVDCAVDNNYYFDNYFDFDLIVFFELSTCYII